VLLCTAGILYKGAAAIIEWAYSVYKSNCFARGYYVGLDKVRVAETLITLIIFGVVKANFVQSLDQQARRRLLQSAPEVYPAAAVIKSGA
jgi:hypothetical protein